MTSQYIVQGHGDIMEYHFTAQEPGDGAVKAICGAKIECVAQHKEFERGFDYVSCCRCLDKREVTVRYKAVDRFSESRKFKTLTGARRYAQKWVGEHPDISDTFGYAVSFDGTGKVTCEGCSIFELFPERTEGG